MNDYPDPPARNVIFAFVIVALAIIGGAALLLLTRPQPVHIEIHPPIPTNAPGPSETPGPITVYVTGAVNQPQTTLQLPAGSRVDTAIDAAGGPNANADLERVNLAQILRDGDQVHVPAIGEDASLPTPGSPGIVHINTATRQELETLPGVGPSLAQRILDFREQTGPFTSMEDLDLVNGIGPALLENLEGLIVFD
jgi:competence protein ComEA